jgi:hypothetical protein
MITTHLTGNFGDHFVRYAMTRSVAEKNGYEWSINKKTSHDYYGGAEQISFFNLDYGIPNNTEYGYLREGITNVWEEKAISMGDHSFHPFQPDIFSVPDNTHLTIKCGQDARYYDRELLRKWFSIDDKSKDESSRILSDNHIDLDENLTVINCRGGEYKGVQSLFLRPEYYINAINYMLSINSNMRFLVITDDVDCFRSIFSCPVYHFSIACDYFIVNNAKNLILSNSGFALFPAWLNKNVLNLVAPKHWARHNAGVWASSAIWTFGKEDNWKFLDKTGSLYGYDDIVKEEDDNI